MHRSFFLDTCARGEEKRLVKDRRIPGRDNLIGVCESAKVRSTTENIEGVRTAMVVAIAEATWTLFVDLWDCAARTDRGIAIPAGIRVGWPRTNHGTLVQNVAEF